MAKPYLKDQRVRRTFILYEFHKNKPIFETFNELSNTMGSGFVDYREFEFWFQRFSRGNFDLDYDTSHLPKTPTLTDLPVDVIQKIANKLGKKYRFTLRRVCQSMRQLVDTWDPKHYRIDIFVDHGPIRVILDTEIYDYKRFSGTQTTVVSPVNYYRQNGYKREVAIDDLVSILKHPNLKLEYFEYNQMKIKDFVKHFEPHLEKAGVRIKTDGVSLKCDRLWEEIRLLRYIQPTDTLLVDLKNTGAPLTKMQLEKLIGEMNETEACMKAAEICIRGNVTGKDSKLLVLSGLKCPRVGVGYEKMETKEVVRVLKLLLKSATLELYDISTTVMDVTTLKKELIDFGAEVAFPDTPNKLIYRNPESGDDDEHFEVTLDEHDLKIERKSFIN